MSTVAKAILVTTVGAVVLAGGLYLWQRPTSRLLVVGDSVTFMSAGAIEDAVERRVDLDFVAEPGYTSQALLPLVEEAGGQDTHDRAVFLVGYNDAIQGKVESPALERLVELSAAQGCAIWLTLPTAELTPGVQPAYPALAGRWNERLVRLAEPHGNVHVATGWADAVGASQPGELLLPDRIHPNAAGSRALATAIADALGRFCGRARS